MREGTAVSSAGAAEGDAAQATLGLGDTGEGCCCQMQRRAGEQTGQMRKPWHLGAMARRWCDFVMQRFLSYVQFSKQTLTFLAVSKCPEHPKVMVRVSDSLAGRRERGRDFVVGLPEQCMSRLGSTRAKC